MVGIYNPIEIEKVSPDDFSQWNDDLLKEQIASLSREVSDINADRRHAAVASAPLVALDGVIIALTANLMVNMMVNTITLVLIALGSAFLIWSLYNAFIAIRGGKTAERYAVIDQMSYLAKNYDSNTPRETIMRQIVSDYTQVLGYNSLVVDRRLNGLKYATIFCSIGVTLIAVSIFTQIAL